ncbi:MAG: TatD family hydrolase [Spirochaetaceae bacterium]|jgi:TatD DNase family protein|nr:TatD family hydrolase [Spirochaetaceae bacterium]
MASDAHAHPYYLAIQHPNCEIERKNFGGRCAASAFFRDEFLFNEKIAQQNDMPQTTLCFAIHPQLPATNIRLQNQKNTPNILDESISFLEKCAMKKRIDCVGETGFDLYDKNFKNTEKIQEDIFNKQIDIALAYNLPVLLHIRRAMHKIFTYTKQLKNLPAVVFHSYSGSLEEAISILKRGINAYFSFSMIISRNHKNAMRCCANLDASRLLIETDAPYQSGYEEKYSSYKNIYNVIAKAAELRGENIQTVEKVTDENFSAVFRKRGGM